MPVKILLLLTTGAITASLPVHAYIGPGAGLSAIGAALALIGALILGIVGFLWYPIKRLMKRRKAAAEVENENAEVETVQEKQPASVTEEQRPTDGP